MESFEGEGTKEIYVEMDLRASLLLMEAEKDGAYSRALAKRGPGLHHLAIDVKNVEEFLGEISGSGWLLHPKSVGTLTRSRTVYLARPGFPALIEVQEGKPRESAPFVEKIELPLPAESDRLLLAIGLAEIVVPAPTAVLTLKGQRVLFAELL